MIMVPRSPSGTRLLGVTALLLALLTVLGVGCSRCRVRTMPYVYAVRDARPESPDETRGLLETSYYMGPAGTTDLNMVLWGVNKASAVRIELKGCWKPSYNRVAPGLSIHDGCCLDVLEFVSREYGLRVRLDAGQATLLPLEEATGSGSGIRE